MERPVSSQPITAILMGKTGHGKSTLSNLLSASNDFAIGNSARSCTKEIKLKCFFSQENQVNVSIIDTPGLSDSDGDDNKIIDDMKQYLIKPDIPRINSILIVISIQENRMDQSLKNLLEEIFKIFPLKNLWEHVIIIWTHYNGTANQKRRLEQKALTSFANEFKELTNYVNQTHNLNIDIIDNFNMIFNEYDYEETDEEVKAGNEAQSIQNINRIIDLMKNTNPLYAEVKPIIKEVELKEEKQIGKFKVMTYENVQYRIYVDFDGKEIKFRDVISEYKIKREDSETEFEPFQPMEGNNGKRISNKYRKYIYYDTDDKFIKEERTDEIIDWKTNEDKIDTKTENIGKNKQAITITKYILECTKDDTNGKKINIQISEQYIEEWREEEKTNKEINENHIGTITHLFFDCLYKIQSGNEIKLSENEKPDKNYIENFEKDAELKAKIIEENGIQYRINYYDVIRIDSRDINKRNSTEYIIQESKNPINVYERNEKKEIKIVGNNIYLQNYKISYYIDRDGKENIIGTQKIGGEEIEEIKTIEIYETEGLTKEEINCMKSNKQYPIDYRRIYYKEEINTKDKKKIPMNKTEHVIINLEHFSDVIKRNNSYILEEYDKEIYIINGQKNNDERPKLNLKELELQEREEKREMSKNSNKIEIQNYKIFYRKEQNGSEKIYKEEPIGRKYPEDIQYKYFEKFEVLSTKQIEEKRKNNSYPIRYRKLYYKEELNTKDKQTILYKTENTEIKIEHCTDFIVKNSSSFYVEYDKELKFINGHQDNNTLNIINKKEIPLQIRYEKKIINIIGDLIYFQYYKIYYAFDGRNQEKIYKEELYEKKQEDIQYSNEIYTEYEGISREQIEEKRKNGNYPIKYKIIYYKKEINTGRDMKKINKIEEIEITKVEEEEIEEYFLNIYIIENYYINGVLCEDKSSKRCVNNIPIKVYYKTKIIDIDRNADKIKIQNYKIYYKIGKDGKEEYYKEEADGDLKTEEIKYEYYYELKGITQDEIEEKKEQKSYPIEYAKIYFKKEVNTLENLAFKINSEDITIFLKHFSSIIKRDNLDVLEEYDQEIVSVNGEIRNYQENPKLNLKFTEKKLVKRKEEVKDGDKISDKWRLFSENEHTFKRYKRYKYIYNFGEPEYSEWERDGVKTYYYD